MSTTDINTRHRPYLSFVKRLQRAMTMAGYATTRSPSGIDVSKLGELTQSSQQNCRRFIRGEALPSYNKLLRISDALGVRPGWLLFGDGAMTDNHKDHDNITIPRSLLLNILLMAFELLGKVELNTRKTIDFIAELIHQISIIRDLDEGTMMRIVRLAVTSYGDVKASR